MILCPGGRGKRNDNGGRRTPFPRPPGSIVLVEYGRPRGRTSVKAYRAAQ